jgi:hypothetical protein
MRIKKEIETYLLDTEQEMRRMLEDLKEERKRPEEDLDPYYIQNLVKDIAEFRGIVSGLKWVLNENNEK